jgi:hypothetical protein
MKCNCRFGIQSSLCSRELGSSPSKFSLGSRSGSLALFRPYPSTLGADIFLDNMMALSQPVNLDFVSVQYSTNYSNHI